MVTLGREEDEGGFGKGFEKGEDDSFSQLICRRTDRGIEGEAA